MKQNMTQDRTINTMKVTTKSLEQRLTQAQSRIEELNSVKGENEDLNKKHGALKSQLEKSIKEIENHKKHQKDMQKKYEDMQKTAAEGSAAIEAQ